MGLISVQMPEFNHLDYAAQILDSQINPISGAEWCLKKAKVQLWSKQKEIFESVENNKLTAVKSGHGVGKSFTASHLAAWWIDTHPPEETMVVSTAPSSRQVSVIMWEEIRKIHRKAELQGEVQRADRWLINGLEVGFGRKPQDYDKHAFQGIHRKYVLVIIDEACGIDEWLWIAALALATGVHCRIVAIGNPDDPSSYFAKVCKPGSGWNVIKISVFDSPNFTGEPVTETARETLTDQTWVDEMRKTVGEGTPTWISKVEGEFPDLDEFSVIPLRWIHDAQERWMEWDLAGRPSTGNGEWVIGADIARYGKDKTVFAHRIGDVIEKVEAMPPSDTVKTSYELVKRLKKHVTAAIDANGLGAGVYDMVKKLGRKARAVNVGARTKGKDASGQIEFYNLRSESMWSLREQLDPMRNPTICLPPDEKLAEDLSAPRWEHVTGGKVVIEDKKALRKRIGRSTDLGDAVILAFWIAGGVGASDQEALFDWDIPRDEEDFITGVVGWDGGDQDWRQVSMMNDIPAEAGF